MQYVENAGVNIAYARWGDGSEPVIYVPPWVSNIELMWELPEFARAYERGGRYLDVTMIDKRGVGMSDRTNVAPTLEDRINDTLAVMDTEGIESAHLIGASEAAAISASMAARHPDRVRSIAMIGAPLPGIDREEVVRFREPDDVRVASQRGILEVVDQWGGSDSITLERFAPNVVGNDRIEEWQIRYERQSASPGALLAHLQSASSATIDGDLDHITCPVFVGHCRGDAVVPVATARYLASRIPQAELTIWETDGHVLEFTDLWAEIQSDVVEFLTGERPKPNVSSQFAVVMFTDIVGSTAKAAEQGDQAWARLIAAHDATADLVVDAHEGRRVKSTGDGMLAIFTDPGQALAAGQRLIAQLEPLGVQVRAGVHAGQIQHQSDGDITGTAVNIAARVEPHAPVGRVAVSRTIVDLMMGEATAFESLGEHDLKGVAGSLELFAVVES